MNNEARMSVTKCYQEDNKYYYIYILNKSCSSSCLPFSLLKVKPCAYQQTRAETWKLASL